MVFHHFVKSISDAKGRGSPCMPVFETAWEFILDLFRANLSFELGEARALTEGKLLFGS